MKTRTSNKYSHISHPTLRFAVTSSLTPSCDLAVAPDSWFDVVGCRTGSMHTSLHTSVRNLAVRSQISLCLLEGKPLAHESVCSMVKFLPQSHLDGRFDGDHLYHRDIASWKAALCSEKPCSLRGRAVNQVEAPFPWLVPLLFAVGVAIDCIGLIVACLCSFFGAHFFVLFTDGGLALQLVSNDVISILPVLVKNVEYKDGGDLLGRLQFSICIL